MTVRAVTPLVPLGGGLQFYRDLDFYDVDQDAKATGTDIYDPEWPDKPLRFGSHRGINDRPTRGVARRVTSPMNAPAGHEAGRYGRPAGATSSQPSAAVAADESTELLGGGPVGSPAGPVRAEPSPTARAVPGSLQSESPSGRHRSGS